MTSTTSEAATALAVRLAARCAADGEFRLAARYWTGTLAIDLDGSALRFSLSNGAISSSGQSLPGAHDIGLAAPREVWDKILAPVPPPFFHDISPARAFGFRVSGDDETLWQYYPAVRRLIDLLREEVSGAASL